MIGMRWSPTDHAVRDFLSRNRIEYKWLDPEQTPEAAALLKEKGIDDAKLPVVLFGDGTALVQPTTLELAAEGRSAHPGQGRVLRRGRRRRGAGGAGGGRLRRVGGTADAGGRAGGRRRAGGIELAD